MKNYNLPNFVDELMLETPFTSNFLKNDEIKKFLLQILFFFLHDLYFVAHFRAQLHMATAATVNKTDLRAERKKEREKCFSVRANSAAGLCTK